MARSIPGAVEGRALLAWAMLSVALTVTASFLHQTDDASRLQLATRNTARLSFAFLAMTFFASPLNALGWRPVGRWLLRNRRYLGLCFALVHGVHGGFVVALGAVHPEAFEPMAATVVAGGFGYVMLVAMTITSYKGPARRIGRRRWKLLHRSGMYLLWGIFTASFVGRTAVSPAYYLPVAICLIGLLLRIVAFQLRRRRRARR